MEISSTRSLKIILLVRDLKPGGVPFTVGPIAHEFQKQGHQVVVYNLGLAEEIIPELFEGIHVVSAGRTDGSGYRGHLTCFLHWQKFLNQYKPDILQSHVGLPDIYAAFSKIPADCKLVRAALTPNLFPAQPLFGFFFERLISPSRFHHHVAVSEGVADALRSTGISAEKISIILNPLSKKVIESIEKELPPHCKFAPIEACKGIRIAYFGRFSPEKGPDRILHWFEKLRPLLPDDSALFLGGLGKMEAELQTLAASLSAKDQIHFLGFISHPADFLPYVHAAINSSRYEGLPIAMLEAAALGCAIAATDSAGARGLLQLVPDFLQLTNADTLEQKDLEKLAEWLRTKNLAKQGPANLTEKAKISLRPESVATQYLRLYQQLFG